MQDIFEQLKAEGQRCQPEFSESLHARCKEAIDQIEASRLSTESAGVPSRNSQLATRNFPIWQAVAAAVLFCAGFAMFNSFFLPPTNITSNLPSEPLQIAEDEPEFQPLVINPMAFEQFELETLAKSFDKPAHVEHQEAKGRSASVFGTVKKMIQKPDPAKTVAASIMRQDISMGSLLVKAGSLAQLPENNSEANPEENE
ncbi:MAG: hypothetical protein IJF84_08525 [Thermoguttaceae bacterium]|nr:hypothetical protein [Thermoguttaceae bacterium]